MKKKTKQTKIQAQYWALDEVTSFKLVNMLPSFFHRIVVKQNIIFDIFRHVELTNDIVWRIEGLRG